MDMIEADKSITVLQAFDAMRTFLEYFWKRGECSSEDIAMLLSMLNRDYNDLMPGDPAAWTDWLDAVNRTTSELP